MTWITENRKRVMLNFITILMLVLPIYTLLALALTNRDILVANNEKIRLEEAILENQEAMIASELNSVYSDLLYLKYQYVENYSFNNPEKAIADWLIFSNQQNIYETIRFVDMNGQERISVENNNGKPISLSGNKLENIKENQHFKSLNNIGDRQIHVSSSELKVNDGVVNPLRTHVINLATPIYQSGVQQGYLILEFKIDAIFDELTANAASSNGNTYMIDSDGYIFFKIELKKGEFVNVQYQLQRFQDKFGLPLWEDITEVNQKNLSSLQGIFVHRHINLAYEAVFSNRSQTGQSYDAVFDDIHWLIVSHLDDRLETLTLIGYAEARMLEYGFLVLLGLVLSYFVSLNSISKERTRKMAERDLMTGTFNRLTGYQFIEKLNRERRNTSKKVSLIFLDINGLKEVNDTLGHDGGDALIIQGVGVLQDCIREEDFLIRMGGDEFLLVLVGSNSNQAEIVWNRIQEKLEEINKSDTNPFIISFAHGLSEFTMGTDIDLHQLIDEADTKMYEEKKTMKNNLCLIKKPVNNNNLEKDKE